MSTESFKMFLESMGHNVRSGAGVYWYDASRRVYVSFPFDREVDPYALDTAAVLGRDGIAARFPCPPEAGRKSFRLVCDMEGYAIGRLPQKARNQTRRGLERCTVRPVTIDELCKDGVRLNMDTLKRQGRKVQADFDGYWKRYFENALDPGGADIWGAFVDNKLAAYLVSFCMEGVANILIVRSDSALLKHYPNNALLFTYIEKTLAMDGIREVSIGFESVQDELGSLDHFKEGLGFRKAPTGQRIEVAGWLKPLLKRPVARGLERVIGAGGGEFSAKLSGMLRWYSEQPELKG